MSPPMSLARAFWSLSLSIAAVSAASLFCVGGAMGCGGDAPPPAVGPKPTEKTNAMRPHKNETHFGDLRQLTFGGENAEAYWAFSGKELILQSRTEGESCDRIVRLNVDGAPPKFTPVSSGKGATTCSYFLPGDKEVIYASTHLGGEACPPKPDMSQGYVWALYDTYDIFRANADGTNVQPLTNEKGYDAEATVCKKDGSIVFTSTRDGDIELYRMDKDGKNVKRLTNTPGYDGGAFFNDDCSKLVWRASRPKAGKELDEFRALLGKGLVRPSKLEIMVGNSDGSDPVQVTYLNAASFAPFFFPGSQRILFSSNYGDPKGREFDLFAVNIDGSGLERVTHSKGFDGFPMFSPDGKQLAFASNRATAEGKNDTNVFVATWVDSSGPTTPVDAAAARTDRVGADVNYLADDAREGRGVGTKGIDEAGAFIEKRFTDLGLEPAGDNGTFRQSFNVVTALERTDAAELVIDGQKLAPDAFTPLGFSTNAAVEGNVVFAGYGIVAKEAKIDDYRGLNVKGKIVVVRRFVPEIKAFSTPEQQRRYGDLRHKAFTARERGAKGIIVVDMPEKPKDAKTDWAAPKEAKLPFLVPEGSGDAGVSAMTMTRAAFEPVFAKLQKKEAVKAKMVSAFNAKETNAFNVVGRLKSKAPKALPGTIVIGAHYDHLGFGGHHSLAPGHHEPHRGADDNASGVAALLETARELSQSKEPVARDVQFIAFSGEEMGTLGSTHFVKTKSVGGDTYAMLNMDMVGRLRSNHLEVMGGDTAGEWRPIADAACERARVDCQVGGGGYGPSDHTPFYAAGVPVLFFFTGQHSDYHKPSDVASRINAGGIGQVSQIVSDIARNVSTREGKLTFKNAPSPPPRGDTRSFHASLGTIPDYAGPGAGKSGVLLAGVREGGAAEKGGLRRGDVLIGLGTHEVRGVEDLMFVLNGAKPGEKVAARVVRDGKEVKLDVTFEEGKGR